MRINAEMILLVEDEPEVRTLAREYLEEHGFRVLVAPSGSAALDLVEREEGSIHLLVTDVVMPQMSGPELANRATAVRPSLKVLYMSGLMGKTLVDEGAAVPSAVVLH